MFFMIDRLFYGRGISSGKKVMKGYYHVSSHGLEKNDIFKSRYLDLTYRSCASSL